MSSIQTPINIRANGKPQPSFNKNFDLLIRHLHQMKANGYTSYICSENPKQFDRLAAIFKELKARRFYEKPSEKQKRKSKEAMKKNKRPFSERRK